MGAIHKSTKSVKKVYAPVAENKHLPFVNREISWLAFNDRVLQEAYDPTVPLMERIKFMGIFSNNLDEFFRVRFATIDRMANLHMDSKSIIGLNYKKAISNIKSIVVKQQERLTMLYHQVLIPELAENKIFIINEHQLNVTRGAFVREYFRTKILPSMVPVMVDNMKVFPILKDNSIYLIVRLTKNSDEKFLKLALLEIPTSISRFLVLPETNNLKYIILIDDVIRYCLDDLFGIFRADNYEAYTIKISRDAELDVLYNDLSENLIDVISKGLKRRKKGKTIRFVYDVETPVNLLELLISKLNLKKEYMIPGGRYHNFKDFIGFPTVGENNLRYKKPSVIPHKDLNLSGSFLTALKRKDILIHLPYQSFNHVLHFLRESAIDPNVVEIKITVYRLAENSGIVNALINAVKNGKKVTVIMELQARFDEKSNIDYAHYLSEEGVKVIQGVPKLKVHSKMCLVIRKEQGKLVNYCNLATGNFNEKTSTIYSDFSLFTSDLKIGAEVDKLFKALEKNTVRGIFTELLVAPVNMRKRFVAMINQEIANAKKGKKATITLKMNSLVDAEMIEKLYEANNAGVQVNLIIRGICSLVAGVKNMSEKIHAISIVDKYLEHSRVFIFHNGGNEKMFVGSADWMTRNLDHRVEVCFPIKDRDLRKELKDILQIQLKDNTKARIIDHKNMNEYKPAGSDKNYRTQVDTYLYLSQKNSLDH